jgi:hypothetical protein
VLRHVCCVWVVCILVCGFVWGCARGPHCLGGAYAFGRGRRTWAFAGLGLCFPPSPCLCCVAACFFLLLGSPAWEGWRPCGWHSVWGLPLLPRLLLLTVYPMPGAFSAGSAYVGLAGARGLHGQLVSPYKLCELSIWQVLVYKTTLVPESYLSSDECVFSSLSRCRPPQPPLHYGGPRLPDPSLGVLPPHSHFILGLRPQDPTPFLGSCPKPPVLF